MNRAILHASQYQNYRSIELIVLHCSATRENQSFPLEAVVQCHRKRGFATIGYHYYITRDGKIHTGRPLYQEGAHATGYNRHSIGICYEGGLDARGQPKDTRTEAQRKALWELLLRLSEDYPDAFVITHRDLNPDKACPCFEISEL